MYALYFSSRSLMLFKDFPCDKAFQHNASQFFYQYFKLVFTHIIFRLEIKVKWWGLLDELYRITCFLRLEILNLMVPNYILRFQFCCCITFAHINILRLYFLRLQKLDSRRKYLIYSMSSLFPGKVYWFVFTFCPPAHAFPRHKIFLRLSSIWVIRIILSGRENPLISETYNVDLNRVGNVKHLRNTSFVCLKIWI
jgi:hypothetical protein